MASKESRADRHHHQAWLDLAQRAARAGASALTATAVDGREVTHQAGRDVKLLADVHAEAAIIATLKEHSGFPLLSEEAGHVGGAVSSGGYRWIIDPLDGTFNYLRGIPFCAVSVALWHGEEPVLGVVIDPARLETFSGLVSERAWLNAEPIGPSSVATTEQAVLCTGFPVGGDFSGQALTSFVERVQAFKKVRMLGSAALSLAYVACGRADVYREDDINLWDIAAGVALVQAAGGTVRIEPGRQTLTRNVTAANGRFEV